MTEPSSKLTEKPWYAEVTRYQWLVLVIASAGWIFDAMEGQIYNVTREAMLNDILAGDPTRKKFWSDALLAAFLLGGTLGGVAFGNLADRVGRKPAMALSILFYSVFSGLTFFATEIWHVAVLRFLVALGVGGEWAVAAALVAEVFPPRARARAGGIFHGTSVAGVWLAAAAGMLVGTEWRYAYLIGVVPALLVLWVRAGIKEPERWQRAKSGGVSPDELSSRGGLPTRDLGVDTRDDAEIPPVAKAPIGMTSPGSQPAEQLSYVTPGTPVEQPRKLGSFRDLFGNRTWARSAILGVLLAAVGLGTFWGIVVAGQDLARELLLKTGSTPTDADWWAKFAYGWVQVLGMLACFLTFGPLAERIGRRATFILLHLGAVIVVPLTCYLPQTFTQLLFVLPLFGFFTGGLHAGYAIYFPELFPNHLRATGTGMCFNGGRLIAAPLLFVSGSIKSAMDLRPAMTMLAGLYLLGVVILLFMPETKGKPLPE